MFWAKVLTRWDEVRRARQGSRNMLSTYQTPRTVDPFAFRSDARSNATTKGTTRAFLI